MASIFQGDLFNAHLLNGAFTTLALNGSTVQAGLNFPAQGKQITKVRFSFASITSPPVYSVTIETMTSTGPNGTDVGGGSPTATTFTPSAGINDITLTNAYTPTLGDELFAALRYSSGTIGASNLATLNRNVATSPATMIEPATWSGTGSWSRNSNFPMISIIYSDGTVQPMTCAIATAVGTGTSFNTGSTPDEVAIKFVAPGNMTFDQLLGFFNTNAASTQATFNLYDSNSNSLTGSDNITMTAAIESTTGSGLYYRPITPVSVTAGQTYYMSLKPTTANNIRYFKTTFPDAAGRKAFYGDAWYVDRTDAGAWSNEDTLSCISLTPVVSSVNTDGPVSGYIGMP